MFFFLSVNIFGGVCAGRNVRLGDNSIMARRYRYSFTKKKEAKKGKLSAGLAAASFLLFITAIILAYFLDSSLGFIVGGVSLFATLLSVYGFIMGLLSFSEEGKSHKTSMIGSIANGLIMVVWLGVYLTGL